MKQCVGLGRLLGKAPSFASALEKIPIAAKCDVSVLLTGETGTGKELFARAVHHLSLRANRPFVPVNCGAIPTELVENELFGHSAGAFTGASHQGLGLIESSEGGTLFLDELDCLSLSAQVKLLRFLQEGEYRPLGSPKMCRADVRIISATNLPIESAVDSGRLRRDLYYRLSVFPIALPALRDRREDIPLLARHFLEKYAASFHKSGCQFSLDALEVLTNYDWPGNVRELEHVVERALLLSASEVVETKDIALPASKPASTMSFRDAKAKMVAQFERNYVQGMLSLHEGNISKAARASSKNRRAFFELLRKHRIPIDQFRKESH